MSTPPGQKTGLLCSPDSHVNAPERENWPALQLGQPQRGAFGPYRSPNGFIGGVFVVFGPLRDGVRLPTGWS